MTYFAFTTLSTVGLGDFHPKQNSERILCSFIMLFGVMFTSLLMDSFSKMLTELKTFNKDFDDSERFYLFLGTFTKLNGDKPLPKDLVSSMEAYFQFRWKYDRNLAVSTQMDRELLDQLPGRVQTELYVTYLFTGFYSSYNQILRLSCN